MNTICFIFWSRKYLLQILEDAVISAKKQSLYRQMQLTKVISSFHNHTLDDWLESQFKVLTPVFLSMLFIANIGLWQMIFSCMNAICKCKIPQKDLKPVKKNSRFVFKDMQLHFVYLHCSVPDGLWLSCACNICGINFYELCRL